MQQTSDWKQQRLNKLFILDSEWDARITLGQDLHQPLHFQLAELLQRLQAMTATHDPVWVLVGGVEMAKLTDDVPLSSLSHAYKPHVHIALMFRDQKTQNDVRAILGYTSNARGIYCQPRQVRLSKHAHWTYFGWRQHHIKPKTKLTREELLHLKLDVDPWLLFEFGEPPLDNLVTSKKELMRCAYLYSNDEDMAQVKEDIARALPMKMSKPRTTTKRPPRPSLSKIHPILKGRKKAGRSREQVTAAKRRLQTWMDKASSFPVDSPEQLHAITVIANIRRDYFDAESNAQLHSL